MSRVRFHAGDIDLELSGSESFVLRQLKLLSTFLGPVEEEALESGTEASSAPVAAEVAPVAEEPAPEVPAPADSAPAPAPPPVNGTEPPDALLSFYRGFQPAGLDRQSDAALLFAYYLQRREGRDALQLGDLIRCCIRAGVDTRNFNRSVGTLTRRGYLETVRHGHAYRLSDQGVAAVESRM
jgi:hypothetical protein